jgi:hypothetical protein
MESFIKDCMITRVENAAGAATTAVTTDVLDMSGWDGVVFLCLLGDVTASSVLTFTAYSNSSNSASGGTSEAATTAHTASATDADNKLLVAEIKRPTTRYVYATLTRADQNAVVDGIVAIQYRGTKSPITQGSTVLASALAAA